MSHLPIAPVGPPGPLSPGAPLGPGPPRGPSGPLSPLGPGPPGGPGGPLGPGGPSCPEGPGIPCSPGSPRGPAGPVAPRAPLVPGVPEVPAGPREPRGPKSSAVGFDDFIPGLFVCFYVGTRRKRYRFQMFEILHSLSEGNFKIFCIHFQTKRVVTFLYFSITGTLPRSDVILIWSNVTVANSVFVIPRIEIWP